MRPFARIPARLALIAASTFLLARLARAEAPNPAYLIEPGDAPDNSVMMAPEDQAADAQNPAQDGTYDAVPEDPGYDQAPAPAYGPPAPAYGAPVAGADVQAPVSDEDPRAIQEFGPRLDPYGTWTTDPNYGQVWLPDPAVVGTGFSPYLTAGHWAVDAGGAQTWVSDYPFGEVVFHYGRWAWTAAGWGWVPGYRYGAAWVAWRLPTDAYGYYGWSPLPPSFVWVNRSPVGLGWRGSFYWVFCSSNFVHSPSPSLYVVHSPDEAQAVARHTRAYVPASPRLAPSGGGLADRTLSSGGQRPAVQQWAPGYRPVTTMRSRTVAQGARPIAPGGFAPRSIAPRPMQNGTPMMRGATPMVRAPMQPQARPAAFIPMRSAAPVYRRR